MASSLSSVPSTRLSEIAARGFCSLPLSSRTHLLVRPQFRVSTQRKSQQLLHLGHLAVCMDVLIQGRREGEGLCYSTPFNCRAAGCPGIFSKYPTSICPSTRQTDSRHYYLHEHAQGGDKQVHLGCKMARVGTGTYIWRYLEPSRYFWLKSRRRRKFLKRGAK